jgi:exonuclease SbcC
MRLVSLQLENFKQYKNQKIIFDSGITGIVGSNGVGKSTIFEGVLFGLYGVRSTGLDSDSIVSSLSDGNTAKVELVFTDHNEEYKVVRTFRQGAMANTHTCSIYRDGELKCSGVNACEEFITDLLHMSPADFRNTVYSGQKDVMALLSDDQSTRKNWFLKMLGYDEIKRDTHNHLLSIKKELELKQNHHQMNINAEDIDRLDAQLSLERNNLEFLKYEIRLNEGRLSKAEEIYSESSQDHEIASKRLSDLNAKAREANTLKMEYDTHSKLLSDYNALYDGLMRTREINPFSIEERVIEIDNQISITEEQIKATNSEISSLEKERNIASQIEYQVESYQKNIQEYKSDLDALRSQAKDREKLALLKEQQRLEVSKYFQLQDNLFDQKQKLKEELDKILYQIGVKKTYIQNMKLDTSICPFCGAELTPEHKTTTISRLEGEIKELEQNSVSAEIDHLSSEHKLAYDKYLEADDGYSLLKSQWDKNEHILETICSREKYISDREADLRELQTDQKKHLSSSDILTKINNLKEDVERLQTILLPNLRAEKETLNKAVSYLQAIEDESGHCIRLNEKVKELDVDPLEIQTLEEKTADLKDRMDRATNLRKEIHDTVGELKFQEKDHQNSIENLCSRFNRYESEKSALQAVTKELKLYSDVDRYIGMFFYDLMKQIRADINHYASQIVSKITGGYYDHVYLDEDFVLRVRSRDGNEYPSKRFSGGEQDVFALALRIALSQYLNQKSGNITESFMILDEIFGSQDEERQRNLLQTLRSQKESFGQIFVISHLDIAGEYDRTISISRGNNQYSEVK